MKSLSMYHILRNLYYKSHSFPIRHFSDVKYQKSFALSSFEGRVDTEQIFPFPKVLTPDQEQTIQQMIGPIVKFFEETNNASKNDELETVEPKSFQGLKELGAFGLQISEENGGVGLNNTQYGRLVEIVGSYDLGIGITLGAHQSIGLKGIVLYGTKEQKEKYLPSLASGEQMAAYCLTEPTAGSDAQSIQCRAVKSADGRHYILNGSKIWISNGGIADIFTVFAQTTVEDDKGIKKDKISAFIVDRSFGGVTHSPPEKKMGIKCSNTAALYFEDCKVPVENLLGAEGQGFKIAMNILNNGRFGMAAALSGTMRTCIKKAINHATERLQFGNKIITYGSIQEKLAKMAVKQYVTEAMAYAIAGNMDRGVEEFQIEAAISKVYGSEAAWFCCDEAIQILGGMGYMKECGLEKVLRDIRIFRIFEGSNDILRLFLVAQGMMHMGKVLKSTNKASILISETAQKLGLQRQIDSKSLIRVVHPQLHSSAHKLAFAIGLFSAEVQTQLIKHQKNIINKQFQLKRLADCTMEIYGMGVALSRASAALNSNEPTAEYQASLARLACSLGSEAVQETISGMRKHGSEDFRDMTLISEEISKFGGVIQPNPLGF